MKTPLLLTMAVLVPIWTAFADRFDDWDQNDDGSLTRGELPRALQRNFDRVDADGNGMISRAEDTAFRQNSNWPRERGPATPMEGYEVRTDVAYAATENERQTLNLYLPEADRAEPIPILVWIHGGGWRGGDKASGISRLHPLLDGSIAGASIGYRLTDEASWPSQIHDCKAAIRWLRGNAEELGIDPERIVVWGSSAGGHLVSMLGTSGDVEELEGDLGDFDGVSSRVRAVVNYFGPSELLTMGKGPRMDHDAPGSPESKLVGGPLQDRPEVAKSASPLTHVSADDPPFLHLHGDEDSLVPYEQAVVLDDALDKAGVTSILVKIEGGGHGFPQPLVNEPVAQFLKKYLWGEDVAEVEEMVIPLP